jgi:hypothetical protein
MRNEKMLEKLVTHEVKEVSKLFNLADKCARAIEGCAWHSQPTPRTGKATKPEAAAAAQSSGRIKNRKKKKSNNNKSLAGAAIATSVLVVAGGATTHMATSDRASPPAVTRAGWGAQCTTLGTTTLRSAGRSRG